MTGTFDTVREMVGAAAGPDLVLGVEAFSLAQIDLLAEAILDCPRARSLPRKPVTEIWPLIPLQSSLFFDHLNHQSSASDYAPAGINLSAATDLRLQGSGTFSDGIVRALLYCHGVLIDDPLSHCAERHLSSPREVREVTRLTLSTAVASLSEISDLLDEGIIQVFYTGGAELEPAAKLGGAMMEALTSESSRYSVEDIWEDFEVEFITGLSAPLQRLWKEVRGNTQTPHEGILPGVMESGGSGLSEIFSDIARILNPHNIVETAVTSTACTLATIELLGGSADVLCASPLMQRLIFIGAPDPVQAHRVHELARTAVPNIDALQMSDLVAIRRASEALATWRTDLAAALDYASRAREGGADPLAVQQGVAEIVAEARNALHQEAQRTRLLSRQNQVSFVAGALGGAGGSAVGGTMGGIAGGAAAGLAAAWMQAVAGRRPIPGFLDRHYVAFAESTP